MTTTTRRQEFAAPQWKRGQEMGSAARSFEAGGPVRWWLEETRGGGGALRRTRERGGGGRWEEEQGGDDEKETTEFRRRISEEGLRQGYIMRELGNRKLMGGWTARMVVLKLIARLRAIRALQN